MFKPANNYKHVTFKPEMAYLTEGGPSEKKNSSLEYVVCIG